jgi:glutathione-regulated potassium-efflux system protein KefB
MSEDFDGAGAGSVVIVGFGRFGQVVTQTMLSQKIEVTVIDSDVDSIRSAARFGFRIYYGDGTRLDVLRAAGAAKARLIAVCIDDKPGAVKIVEIVKSEFPQARIYARAFDRVHAIELLEAGVDRFVRETFDSALHFGRISLEEMGLAPDEALELVADVRKRDLQRLDAQRAGDIYAGQSLLRGIPGTAMQGPPAAAPQLTPEPLVRPKKAAEALSAETKAAIEQAAGGEPAPNAAKTPAPAK